MVGQLHSGGAERQLYELATRLDRGRFEPFVACLSQVTDPFGPMLASRGVEVRVLPRARSRELTRVAALARLLRSEGADLAHSYLLAANAYTWAATRLAGRRPFIASSRTCMPPRSRWSLAVHRRAFRSASAVVANARRVLEFTRDLYRIPEARLRVIPNGVPMEPFLAAASPDREQGRRALRAEWKADDATVVAGSLGRLSAEKNLPLFLAMASNIAASPLGGRVRFVVAGEGPASAALRREAARRGLGPVLVFTGERRDVPETLAAMDLFVLTSDTEGMPNAVMEAMAAGLPVVATRVGGTEELIQDGSCGALVPPGALDPLERAVSRLASDPAARRRLGEAARERIAAHFSARAMVEATSRLYDEVAG